MSRSAPPAARGRRVYEPMTLTPHAFGAVSKQSGLVVNTRAPQVPTAIVERIEGCAAADLTRRFGSPLFVVSRTQLLEEFRAFRDAFRAVYADTTIAYSYKTNYLTAIRAALHEEGAWAEVVSGLEYEMARRLGVPGSQIVFNGPYKDDEDVRRAIREDAFINVDSFDELAALEEIAAADGRTPAIGLRLTARTTPTPWEKFGFSVEAGLAEEACRRAAGSKHVRLAGLHMHLGTDLAEPEAYAKAIDAVTPLLLRYEKDRGVRWQQLDFGGGFPNRHRFARAHHGMTPESVFPHFAERLVRPLTAALRKLRSRPRLVLEPGRAVVEHPVFLLTTVVAAKRLPGGVKAAVLDAGVHLLPTAYYTALDVAPVDPAPLSVEEVTLFGPLCMQVDCLAAGLRLPPLRRGTRLAVRNCGAYADSQSMQFIHARPAVVMVTGRHAEVVREAESVDHFLARDRVPARARSAAPRNGRP
jgi:diaminopimelate decarboxylase